MSRLLIAASVCWASLACAACSTNEDDSATSDESSEASGDAGGDSAEASGDESADTTGASETGAGACSALEPTCAEDGGYVDGGTVEGWLDDGPLLVVDARSASEYAASHLPGAVNVDPASVRATVDGIGGQVADVVTLADVFSTAGLSGDVPVVVYGADIETGSARLVWTLAYAGHAAPVYLLDGGFAAWSAEGRPVEAASAPPLTSTYTVSVEGGTRVDGDWVFAHLDDPTVSLVDARTSAEYDAGHIPGAIHVDWTTNVGPTGVFAPIADLFALYQMPPSENTLVVYCVTGSRASVGWVVLRALGYSDVRLYDGSWTEWSMNAAWPVETP